MEKRNGKSVLGFTLVELIVVITILAILGTIAIMAFSGYSKNARDSARISDVSRIISGVELFQVAKGFFPEPSNGVNITYSGATAWTQGTFGDSTVINVEKINKKPVDPLTGSEYAYSITQSKKEFQIGAIYEGDSIAVVPQTYAAEAGKALVKGNYNGSILKVSTGSVDYILAIPSILASDIELSTDVLEIVGNDRLVFDKYSNLPASYKGSNYEVVGDFGYNKTEAELVVFSGSVLDLKDEAKQLTFFKNLQDAYAGTVVSNEPEIQNVLAYDTEANEEGSLFTAQVLINEKVTNSVKVTATNQNNAGGNTNPGGGDSGGDTGGETTITQGAGNFNYSFFPENGTIPTSMSTLESPEYMDHDRRWTPIEIETGKVMIMDNNGNSWGTRTEFGFFSVASNGQITHLFSKQLSEVISIPEGWNTLGNSMYQFDNVLHLGGGKFIVVSSESDGNYGITGYHLFQANISSQTITYLDSLDFSAYENPTLGSDYYSRLGNILDSDGNIRVVYKKAITWHQGGSYGDEYNNEIWMQKISVVNDELVSSEDQKLIDTTDAQFFGFTADEYIELKSIIIEKVSGNKGIIGLSFRVNNKGIDGIVGPDENWNNDDFESQDVTIYTVGVNFSTPTYSIGSYKKIVSETLGSDWPIFGLSVGGDRVVFSSVAYNGDEEPYVVVTKLNQSTLEITSGNVVMLTNVEGYYFQGIERINDNKIIIAGETNPPFTYGTPIPNGMLPFDRWDTNVVDNIANLTYPINNGYFVFEMVTGKSYKIANDRNSVTEITNYQDPWDPESTSSGDYGGGAFWEIDLGVGNLTPINVTETLSGHLGDYTDGVNNMFELDDARMLRLSSGQIYMNSTFNTTDGTLDGDNHFTKIEYPHIILTPN